MVYEAETLKRIEEAFDVINDYTIDLYYLSTQVNGKVICYYISIDVQKTKMGFIIVLAIYGAELEVIVPIFLFGLFVWYGSFFASGCAEAEDIIGF